MKSVVRLINDKKEDLKYKLKIMNEDLEKSEDEQEIHNLIQQLDEVSEELREFNLALDIIEGEYFGRIEEG